ncbi:hypothetical protein B0H34DRAFT_721676, partial [Crassisporium funariophilum]
TPRCPCCGQHDETVFHYILRCQAHRNARATMTRNGGVDATRLDRLLSKKEALPHLFKFIASSARLRSVFGDIPAVAIAEPEAGDHA